MAVSHLTVGTWCHKDFHASRSGSLAQTSAFRRSLPATRNSAMSAVVRPSDDMHAATPVARAADWLADGHGSSVCCGRRGKKIGATAFADVVAASPLRWASCAASVRLCAGRRERDNERRETSEGVAGYQAQVSRGVGRQTVRV
jgi:hypothetical protein